MNKLKYIIASFFIVAATLVSCDYDDFDNPAVQEPVVMTPTRTIKQVINMYSGSSSTITSEEDIIISGKVISSDREGNIYKTLIIEDETGGIKIKSGLTGLYNFYKEGQVIYVKCNGLQLGAYGRSVEIGFQPGEGSSYETDYIPAGLFMQYVFAGEKETPVTPRATTIEEINGGTIPDNTLISLSDVQFLASEAGQVAWSVDESSGVNRTLQNRADKRVVVRTSGYSRFALETLPAGSGSIKAIITYFNSTPQLTVVSINDVNMNNPRF